MIYVFFAVMLLLALDLAAGYWVGMQLVEKWARDGDQ